MTIETESHTGSAIRRGPSTTSAVSAGDSTAGDIYHDIRGDITCLAHFSGTAAATIDYTLYDATSHDDPGVSLESDTITLDADGDGHLSAPAWRGVFIRFELTSATEIAVDIVSH